MLRRCVRIMSCGEWIGCLNGMKFHTSASKVLCAPFDKDLPNPSVPTPLNKVFHQETDILLEQLKKAKTVDRIFELSSMHLEVMNSRHLVTCLENINNFMPKQEYSPPPDLLNHPAFQGICSRLMKTIRFLDPQELITVFKVLSNLGVRNNTYVMQALLKMIGGHLNEMNLGQLTFLNFLLSKQRHNSLVDGLRLALPLVLQVQIEQQLDSDNITEIVDCLQLACRSRLKPAVIQKVLTAVLEKAKSLSYTSATTVIFALLNLDTPMDGYRQLVDYSFEVLSRNIELMDVKHIISLLRLCGTQNFYHSRFYFNVADRICSEKWSLENTWEVVRTFNRMNFSPPNLKDHLVNVIRLESDAFRTEVMYNPLQCIEYLTTTGYHPPHVEEVLTILCSCEGKIASFNEKSPYLTVKFLSHLAMMGHFPEPLLTQILNEDGLFSTWYKCRKLGRGLEFERSMLSLVWSLEVYDRQRDFSVPSAVLKNLIHNVCERHSDFSCPLQKFIENGLGGSQFLKSGILTCDGLLVDHVVAMRSGNYPVSLQSLVPNQPLEGIVFIEDIVLPADAKIVAVIVATEDRYCRDPEVLKGWMDLKVKYLLKKKVSPVVVNYSSWRDLPDREKIPYLMQLIKNASQLDSILNTI